MRFLLIAVVVAALGWSGYWFFGARSTERGLEDWLVAREAEGWAVGAADISTIGFPNRFDTTLSELELADPETGVAWKAPFFQILTLSYKPHHIVVVWPDRQSLATPNQTIAITSADMRGSLVFEPDVDLALDRSTFEFDSMGLVSTADWNAALENGLMSVRQTPGTRNSYDFSLKATGLRMPGGARDAVANSGMVSDSLETVQIDATILFDAPWDRHAIEERRPQPRHIDLQGARATWGQLDLRIAGELAVDGEGKPSGEITVKATNWRDILQLAIQTGALPKELGGVVEGGLNMVARMSGNSKTIDVPLTFKNGRVTLAGLIPLGPAPKLVLR